MVQNLPSISCFFTKKFFSLIKITQALRKSIFFLSLAKISIMSDKYFDESTAAAGFIYTIVAIAIIASVLIWG